MKRYVFIMTTVVVCCAGHFVACNTTPNEPENEQLNEVQKKGRELAEYLSDNYATGDSIYLTTETGSKEGYQIIENYYSEARKSRLLDGSEKDYEIPEIVLCSTVTKLYSETNELVVMISVFKDMNGQITILGHVYVNDLTSRGKSVIQNEDRIDIESENGNHCVLQKGKGIISISTPDGKKWNL